MGKVTFTGLIIWFSAFYLIFFELEPQKTKEGEYLIAFVLMLFFYYFIYKNFIYYYRFLDAEYIIDQFGPRALNKKLNLHWCAIPERAGLIEVKIEPNVASLIWGTPAKSYKTGVIVFRGEGFWFVNNYKGMVEALEKWQALVESQKSRICVNA